jgi:RNA-directed DNA polymerase
LQELTNIRKFQLTGGAERIQEFQKKLYEKAKASPKFRFYSLYDKTYRTDVLEEAYRKVKANGGASGVDRVTFEDIKAKGIIEYLAELQDELKEGKYKPNPVRRVYIPKANGKKRPLGIPTIRDRIVQTAFLMVLEPIFEADFSDSSYGFRPRKSAHDAVREIYKYLNWGCEEIYDVDLEKYFDTVEHWKLMRLLARRISDGKILHVIKQWLSCGYVEDNQHRQSKRGTPQGGVISPLLANVYLHPVDKACERNGIKDISKGSIHLVRYADDMLILAQKNLRKGVEILENYVERLGLKLNKEKSRRLNLKEDRKVEFLGFQFHRVQNKKTKNRLVLVAPSPKSQKRCREQIRKLVSHKIPLKVQDQVINLNRFLVGWTGYFKLGNASKVLYQICAYVMRRVRRLLQRNRGRNGFGWNRWSNNAIYERFGLFYNYKVQWL